MLSKLREPVNGFTHMFGALLSLAGMIYLLHYCAVTSKGPAYSIPFLIFGISLILLYTASSVYHLVTASDKVIKVLRRIDHSMIFVLIAGTYTPICLIALKGVTGLKLLAAVWIFAISGILMKIFWFDAPRWLSTVIYVLMGWLAVWVMTPLSRVLSINGILLMFAGGILYTIGAVIYGTKWPKFKNKYFGSHEIFHIFVLMGSLCFYILMSDFLIYL